MREDKEAYYDLPAYNWLPLTLTDTYKGDRLTPDYYFKVDNDVRSAKI